MRYATLHCATEEFTAKKGRRLVLAALLVLLSRAIDRSIGRPALCRAAGRREAQDPQRCCSCCCCCSRCADYSCCWGIAANGGKISATRLLLLCCFLVSSSVWLCALSLLVAVFCGVSITWSFWFYHCSRGEFPVERLSLSLSCCESLRCSGGVPSIDCRVLYNYRKQSKDTDEPQNAGPVLCLCLCECVCVCFLCCCFVRLLRWSTDR